MNRVPLSLILTLCLASVPSLRAQTARTEIKPLLWMLGDWTGRETGGDSTLDIRLHARLTDNGQAIAFDVSFEQSGKHFPKYEGLYYWNPAERQIKLLQTSAEGNLAEGVYSQHDSVGDQFVTVKASNGASFELKSHWQIASDQFRFKAEFRPSGTDPWQPAIEALYKRTH